jgi:hypothetical protein
MKRLILLCMALSPFLATRASAATWEMLRINVSGDLAASDHYEVVCDFTPSALVVRTVQGAVTTGRTIPLWTDDAAIQALIDAVPGIAEPSFDSTTNFTNWWVRSNPYQAYKLVRTNVTYANGTNYVQNDTSSAGGFLAVWMGINCPRAFGQ